ncbi:MAG: radical SAM protein [Pseudomonadota bacterium]
MNLRKPLDRKLNDILNQAQDMAGISQEQAVYLLRLDLCSPEVYALMGLANGMSRQAFGGKGERHFHIGLNVEGCAYNCKFCSLAKQTGLFTQPREFGQEQLLAWARQGQEQGADALNLMTTGRYPFARLLEVGAWLSREVSVPLVANTRDINHQEGEALLAAGFKGFYHAVRLREGTDTPFAEATRLQTVKVITDVGLAWMNCIEPVGPEHQPEEIARLMVLAREMGATYSGVMRRINFPGSPLGQHGMINELEMARMVAVSRLVMGGMAKAHCTHEPNSAALMAGANLLFPEVGSSPRDAQADTGQGRGQDLAACGRLHREMGWDAGLPSNCFGHGQAGAGDLAACPSHYPGRACGQV